MNPSCMHRHPHRVWRLQGAANFRDLGGYRAENGRSLRWRQLFRSDHFGSLTAEDQMRLSSIGLSRVLDFRGAGERASAPNRLSGVTEHSLAIEPTVAQRMHDLEKAGAKLTGDAAAALMQDLYLSFVVNQAHRFAELFEHLLSAASPLVFHCTAGKDRTGFAAALVLLALRVPREQVMADYLLSNDGSRQASQSASSLSKEALAVLQGVQAGFLDRALRSIDQDHGGVERYLEVKLRLTPAARRRMSDIYLEEDSGPLARNSREL
jgi:protein-tyrosine phosphatase